MILLRCLSAEDNRIECVRRLQMKGKYEDLAPLMAKISDALKAREKAQSLVKKLINELDFARNELTTSHQTYTGLVQQLMKSKESIDKRLVVFEMSAFTIKSKTLLRLWTET